jgi:hypothetical protein
MPFPENESEGNNEELVTEIVADVQDPVPPIVWSPRLGQGSHDFGRVITSLGEVAHHGAEAMDEYLLRVGAVETWVMFNSLHMGRVAMRS